MYIYIYIVLVLTNARAQMHKKHTLESIVLGKDSFEVTVYPNVDHAFVLALVIVLDEINADRNAKD